MRSTILLWSLASGALLGLFCGLLLFALVVLAGEVAGGAAARFAARARVPVVVLCFVVIPAAGAWLGWLEGRLKLR